MRSGREERSATALGRLTAWAVLGVALLGASSAGCRFGAATRLHEEPARVEIVYHEAAPIRVVAPAAGTGAQAR